MRRWWMAVVVLGVALFGGLGYALPRGGLQGFDTAVSSYVIGLRHPLVTPLMIGVTYLGVPIGITVVTLVLAIILSFVYHLPSGRRLGWQAWVFLTLALLGSWQLEERTKVIFHRPRPPAPLFPAGGYSFPSGHATVTIAVIGMAAYLLWYASAALTDRGAAYRRSRIATRYTDAWGTSGGYRYTGKGAQTATARRLLRALTVAVAVLLVFLVGVSRVYLADHYPSDVLAGWGLGGAWLGVVVLLHQATAARR